MFLSNDYLPNSHSKQNSEDLNTIKIFRFFSKARYSRFAGEREDKS